jgi:hypothetical protein
VILPLRVMGFTVDEGVGTNNSNGAAVLTDVPIRRTQAVYREGSRRSSYLPEPDFRPAFRDSHELSFGLLPALSSSPLTFASRSRAIFKASAFPYGARKLAISS